MFVSFFPRPRLFFLSAALWAGLAILVWYLWGTAIQTFLGLAPEEGVPRATDVTVYWHGSFLFFYVYFAIWLGAFAAFWTVYSPHRWQWWSIVGTGLILFFIYFSVQVSVVLNEWRGPFFDSVQQAMTPDAPLVSEEVFYSQIWTFTQIALVNLFFGVINTFFVSHWIFRWRTAMNNYFVDNWQRLRKIEGASQRVQEDTMRFAETMESLFLNFISAFMLLLAFLPLLAGLSERVPDLPVIGAVPYSLVFAAIVWSVAGTALVALVGFKLPGLNFKNQRVEAAFRKELVFGEDDESRAEPPTLRELFGTLRKNYFRLYFHYLYFSIARSLYIQVDNIFIYLLLIPAIAARRLTLGVYQQIQAAFGNVSNSFQYLFNVWPTIIELISIYKRLRAFEATLAGKGLSGIELERDAPPDAPLPPGADAAPVPISTVAGDR